MQVCSTGCIEAQSVCHALHDTMFHVWSSRSDVPLCDERAISMAISAGNLYETSEPAGGRPTSFHLKQTGECEHEDDWLTLAH